MSEGCYNTPSILVLMPMYLYYLYAFVLHVCVLCVHVFCAHVLCIRLYVVYACTVHEYALTVCIIGGRKYFKLAKHTQHAKHASSRVAWGPILSHCTPAQLMVW